MHMRRLVPATGIEPVWPFDRKILNLLCIPNSTTRANKFLSFRFLFGWFRRWTTLATGKPRTPCLWFYLNTVATTSLIYDAQPISFNNLRDIRTSANVIPQPSLLATSMQPYSTVRILTGRAWEHERWRYAHSHWESPIYLQIAMCRTMLKTVLLRIVEENLSILFSQVRVNLILTSSTNTMLLCSKSKHITGPRWNIITTIMTILIIHTWAFSD